MPVKKKVAPVKKAPAKKVTAAKKVPARKATTAAKKPVKKVVAKKPAAKKIMAKKLATKKTVPKKPVAKKVTAAKKPAVKKVAAKKITVKKKATTRSADKVVDLQSPDAQLQETDLSGQTTAVGMQSMGIAPYQLSSSEEYMNETQREHFRQLLLSWRQNLMEEVDQTVSHLRNEATNTLADPNDRATREEAFGLELRTRNREGKLLKKITEALDKLKNDEYGYCDMCGVEIGIRRLEARPTANLCIDCKTLDEIKERQQGG